MRHYNKQVIPLGTIEYSKRPDGKFNIWKWVYTFRDDIIPSWTLVGVTKKPRYV